MKKLFVFLALVAYVFSDTCSACQDDCKSKYKGLFKTGKRRSCIYDCILEKC